MTQDKQLADLARTMRDLERSVKNLAAVAKALNENLIETFRLLKKIQEKAEPKPPKEVDVSWVTTVPGEPGRKEK